MSEVTKELIYETLLAIQADIAAIQRAQMEFRSFRIDPASYVPPLTAQRDRREATLADHEKRLERIERKLATKEAKT